MNKHLQVFRNSPNQIVEAGVKCDVGAQQDRLGGVRVLLDLAGPGVRVSAAAEHDGPRAAAVRVAAEQRARRDGDAVRAGAAERALGQDVHRVHGVGAAPGDPGGAQVPPGLLPEGGDGAVSGDGREGGDADGDEGVPAGPAADTQLPLLQDPLSDVLLDPAVHLAVPDGASVAGGAQPANAGPLRVPALPQAGGQGADGALPVL